MYSVSLIKLSADATRVVDSLSRSAPTAMADAELKILLQTFIKIDALDNAVSAPEIRVKTSDESYLIRTEHQSLLLYDILHQERPALVLTVEETIAELDGSALAARRVTSIPEAEPEPEEVSVELHTSSPIMPASKPRLIGMGVIAFVLLGAIIYLQTGAHPSVVPPTFLAASSDDSAAMISEYTGVYMTGNQPGEHGIVIATADEVKLFELRAKAAPGLVYATTKPGHIESQPAIATDQPGGVIVITDPDTLVYCGEVYRRIP